MSRMILFSAILKIMITVVPIHFFHFHSEREVNQLEYACCLVQSENKLCHRPEHKNKWWRVLFISEWFTFT